MAQLLSTNINGTLTVTGNTTAPTFIGNLSGTADKAKQDGNGNTITSYYCTLSTAQTLSGQKTFSKSPLLSKTSLGYYAIDSAGNSYPVAYDNGSDLWIGAEKTANYHHKGATYISAGHDGTSGNETIYVSVPADADGGGTNYKVLHAGNYTNYPKVGTATVGGAYRPIYLNGGTATACKNMYTATASGRFTWASKWTNASGYIYYSEGTGLIHARFYGVYTPTAAVAARELISVGTITSGYRPGGVAAGSVYRGTTGAGAVGSALVSAEGVISIRLNAALTANTAYGIYCSFTFREASL